jgi:hypothetical protein
MATRPMLTRHQIRHRREAAARYALRPMPDVKPIPRCPLYGIDGMGNVWHIRTRKMLMPWRYRGRWWIKLKRWRTTNVLRAVLVCEAWHGRKANPDWHCRHLNNDSLDDRPENLAWGSALDNSRDRWEGKSLIERAFG